MKVLGVIPARYKSTRLPAKPLADLLGKPMVQRVYENAQRATHLDSVIVATDDQRIFEAVKAFGGSVVMTDPNHASGTDRVAEVAAGTDAALIVNVQGDEPLLDPMMIDECVQALKDALSDENVGMSTVAKKIGDEGYHDPSVVKLVQDLRGRALYFSRSLIPYPRFRTEAFGVLEHVGLYAYTRNCLQRLSHTPPGCLEQIEGLEQLRALENGISIQVVQTKSESEMVSVDTPEDLERVRRILANGAKG
jgi:3-deoxy-manno-octulosonate cytidylyltransferase (CMP-KDO synthetase)